MSTYTLDITERESGNQIIIKESTDRRRLRLIGNKKLGCGEAIRARISDNTGDYTETWSTPIVRFKVSMPKRLWQRLYRDSGRNETRDARMNYIVGRYLNQYENREYIELRNLGGVVATHIFTTTEERRRAIDRLVGISRICRDNFIESAVERYYYAYG